MNLVMLLCISYGFGWGRLFGELKTLTVLPPVIPNSSYGMGKMLKVKLFNVLDLIFK